jgi:hypothetical protein
MDLGFCAIFSSFVPFYLSIAEFGYIPSITFIPQFNPIWSKIDEKEFQNALTIIGAGIFPSFG